MGIDYSLTSDCYRGINKSCFAVALNIAYDNCDHKGCRTLLSEVLRSKGGISDEQIKSQVVDGIQKRLKDIRNYFSHYYHAEDCLRFGDQDAVKVFLEEIYKNAESKTVGATKESDYKGVVPPLFELHNGTYMITAAGVIFLASFFCHRSNVYRMLGAVKGFKHTGKEQLSDGQKRDYGFTRRLLAYYALRDSYSVGAEDKTRCFREILSYLSRVPQLAVDWLNEQQLLTPEEKEAFLNQPAEDEGGDISDSSSSDKNKKSKEKRRSLRRDEKFILFAIQFIEGWAAEQGLDVTFARYQKTVEKAENKNQDGKQARAVQLKYRNQGLNPDFNNEWMYYIQNEHAIIQIKLNNKKAVAARISENELKYLVLLIFEEKGNDAVQKLNCYIYSMSQKIEGEWKHRPEDERWMPSFTKRADRTVTPEAVQSRLSYIRKQLQETIEKIGQEEPRNNKWLIYKGKKISMILKFISDSIRDIQRRPNVKQYHILRDALQRLDFDGFYKELQNYVNDGRIAVSLYDQIKGVNDISGLCKKVCELTLERLAGLEAKNGSELRRYIGLEAQEKHPKYGEWNTLQEKAKRFLESQFSIGKNFLRKMFYGDCCQKRCFDEEKGYNTQAKERKSLYSIVKEKLKDIKPIHDDRWYLIDRNPKNYDNKHSRIIRQMCNTYIQDVLCMKMAMWHYEKLISATEFRNKLEWNCIGQGNMGYERYSLWYKTGCGVVIQFTPADFLRLDIIEKPAMIENICQCFVLGNKKLNSGAEKKITWDKFNKDGIAKYRKRQAEAVRAIFAFEEGLKIQEDKWSHERYFPFCNILDEAVKQGKIKDTGKDKEALNRGRNDFFHEEFKSTEDQQAIFQKYFPIVERKDDTKKRRDKKQK